MTVNALVVADRAPATGATVADLGGLRDDATVTVARRGAEDGPAITRRRLAAQLLTHGAVREPAEVARHLLAVQAQDDRGVRLALRSRSTGLRAGDVDRLLTDDRSVLITWLNRGTLHLVHREDYPWLHALTTPQLAVGNSRRLAQEGVPADAADAGVRVIEKALSNGPLTRRHLREHLDSAGIRTQGQALVHLIARSSIAGTTIRGPVVGKEQAFVLTRDWIGRADKVDRHQALAELARRFLRGHGPADERDLAKWAGITLGDARRALAAISTEIADLENGLVDLVVRVPVDEWPPPRLLGPFDPVLLGWTSREAIVGRHAHLVTINGLFRPFPMVGGRATGTWSMKDHRVKIDLLETITDDEQQALAEEAVAVEHFFGWR